MQPTVKGFPCYYNCWKIKACSLEKLKLSRKAKGLIQTASYRVRSLLNLVMEQSLTHCLLNHVISRHWKSFWYGKNSHSLFQIRYLTWEVKTNSSHDGEMCWLWLQLLTMCLNILSKIATWRHRTVDIQFICFIFLSFFLIRYSLMKGIFFLGVRIAHLWKKNCRFVNLHIYVYELNKQHTLKWAG